MKHKVTLLNQVEELTVLAAKIEELAERWKLPVTLTTNLNLVLEEAVSNVIFYAFPEGGQHPIDITLSLSGKELSILIEDEGIPFDPTANELPDTSLPAEERQIGGLGIFLIRKIMDTVTYSRDQGKNKLTLKKKIEL